MPPKNAEPDFEPKGAARFARVRKNLRMGIVGLPNVGKSSLFNLLTEQAVAAENYPFCTIEPNESRCPVPDERYDWLCNMWKPASEYPAYLYITDIAGLVRGAAEGAGLGNNFLSHISAVDGIFHVVRAFDNDEVVHVDDSIDPIRDLETIQMELCKKDLEYVLAAEEKETKEVKRSPGSKLSPTFLTTFEKIKAALKENKPIRNTDLNSKEVEMVRDKLNTVITTKPCVYLVNLSMNDYIRKKNKWLAKIVTWVNEHGGGVVIPFSVEFETKLWDLRENPDGKQAFLDEHKVGSCMPKMVVQGFKELSLIYFFTAGEKEVRCWTIQKGTYAPGAAGAIHSDMERGFIKAEVVSYTDYRAISTQKGMTEVKAAGKYRQEGKQYLVQDGDIMYFQFNANTPSKK
uniref:Obg-like ATPase homolog n=1 Tax=Polytomella parva TaxID=51329 RepID=A0A7S0UYI7_9CHLO|mmetsp:Transcript_22884/g.40449  ORF Transcript_22884/g.40449 Transcript_22884/m.40449 type:complete len:403 (+) Transcript_22884:71-1279(+)|eukprot:CAMPEP_0175078642 /NCGR_PEP_ID=MMETSP0052_2-20121109/24268_1 /TAXON_ID=51329 ORGANISM="Polytomella parva, Strain SAG 63-3" /NCGR_SAMPLE_ID=MMETSP0052_2 /ASSEMBLY_ACC=CAM_ASM_000194 /LENGTH=402 /DNA_ID=CAMNT_0016348659 /DNA_START=39 /DNA_END=1247 /DNA_ORIENTATION=+